MILFSDPCTLFLRNVMDHRFLLHLHHSGVDCSRTILLHDFLIYYMQYCLLFSRKNTTASLQEVLGRKMYRFLKCNKARVINAGCPADGLYFLVCSYPLLRTQCGGLKGVRRHAARMFDMQHVYHNVVLLGGNRVEHVDLIYL